ncbi:unnamed protein product [Strongylus vulgaris]|uniref:G-protein coupled receptors family 1 profile domain-containing protein n=1 Tax=Strongylus vulgaris TaxID=40348 RepID=A0A3P7J484_STRVU|nr:unnamed protein product [Strongylus vulgaris]
MSCNLEATRIMHTTIGIGSYYFIRWVGLLWKTKLIPYSLIDEYGLIVLYVLFSARNQERKRKLKAHEKIIRFLTFTDDLLLAASMAATVFNVMVIFCAVKLFKRSGDTMHLFILNMTVGDLILTVFCHPNELLIRKHDFLQQIHLCAVVHYFNWTGLAVSGFMIVQCRSEEPLYFVFLFGCSLSGEHPFLLVIEAVMTQNKKFYYEIFLILFCVLPVTSSLIVSIYLFNLTRQKRNARSGGDSSAFKNKVLICFIYICVLKYPFQVKSLVFIFATTAWTSCSLLPYRIMNLARIHFFTYIINPLITSLIYAPYRMTIKKFLVNIPVGNRPFYNYQGEHLHLDSSFASLRRSRNRRSSSTESASLRQSTEVRISMGEPCTPSKSPSKEHTEQEFSFEKKIGAIHADPHSH